MVMKLMSVGSTAGSIVGLIAIGFVILLAGSYLYEQYREWKRGGRE